MKIANKKYQIFDKPSNSELFSRNFEVIEQSGNQATAIFRNKLSFKQLFLRCLPFCRKYSRKMDVIMIKIEGIKIRKRVITVKKLSGVIYIFIIFM